MKKHTYKVHFEGKTFIRTTANIYTHMLVGRAPDASMWKQLCFCGNIGRAEAQYKKWKGWHSDWTIRILEIPQPTDIPTTAL